MREICPYCNGLTALDVICPICSSQLIDNGTLQEALGPYAPYEENSSIHSEYGCVHLLVCPSCQAEYSYTALPAYNYTSSELHFPADRDKI